MPKPADLLQGTLDLLILKAVSLGALHGYGVLLRIQQISNDRLQILQGSLYPALYRLEHQGLIMHAERVCHGSEPKHDLLLTFDMNCRRVALV